MAKNLMAGTWTKAAKVRRALKAGPRRKTEVAYDCETAILRARIFWIEVRKTLLDERVFTASEDVKVALALIMRGDRVLVLPIPREMGDLPELAAKIGRLEKTQDAKPLGLVVWLRDRESDDAPAVWIHPWLLNERAASAATAAFADGKEAEGSFRV